MRRFPGIMEILSTSFEQSNVELLSSLQYSGEKFLFIPRVFRPKVAMLNLIRHISYSFRPCQPNRYDRL